MPEHDWGRRVGHTCIYLPISQLVAITDRSSPLGDCSADLGTSVYSDLTYRAPRRRLRIIDRCSIAPLPVAAVGGGVPRYLVCAPTHYIETLRAERAQQACCHTLDTTVCQAAAFALDELLADAYYSTRADRARALLHYYLWLNERATIRVGGRSYRCDTLVNRLLGLDATGTTIRRAIAQITEFDPRSLRVRKVPRQYSEVPSLPMDRVQIDGEIPQAPRRNDIEPISRQRVPAQGRLFGGVS